jgi:hypothetical protein
MYKSSIKVSFSRFIINQKLVSNKILRFVSQIKYLNYTRPVQKCCYSQYHRKHHVSTGVSSAILSHGFPSDE